MPQKTQPKNGNGNGETKICKVIYEIEVRWKDAQSEEIALAAKKIICCKCDNDD